MKFNSLYLLVAIVLLFTTHSCSPSVRSVKIKSGYTSISVEIETVQYDNNGNLDKMEPPSAEEKQQIDNRLQSVCAKYNATYSYNYTYDSLAVIWKLQLPDLHNFNNLVFDLFAKNDGKVSQLPLNIKTSSSSDSIFISLTGTGEVFVKNALVSFETPTPATVFSLLSPSQNATPFLVAPNKIEYSFLPVSDKSMIIINCAFKKSTDNNIPATQQLPPPDTAGPVAQPNDEERITLFGIRAKYWEFWCAIIGAVGTIIGVIMYFVKKKN